MDLRRLGNETRSRRGLRIERESMQRVPSKATKHEKHDDARERERNWSGDGFPLDVNIVILEVKVH